MATELAIYCPGRAHKPFLGWNDNFRQIAIIHSLDTDMKNRRMIFKFCCTATLVNNGRVSDFWVFTIEIFSTLCFDHFILGGDGGSGRGNGGGSRTFLYSAQSPPYYTTRYRSPA